ncbi:putative retinol dehydrogenase 12-like [Apostichopus japonicus]|uniref:Putative retinol dehydrogenase 12-like n=1 Tax=Stichopus japonicus TaxID=307972 RepID=A0A2G8JFY4_STIJA|nr:putative retinol dehydrogenase 12-like [Apostichopus japonicus]
MGEDKAIDQMQEENRQEVRAKRKAAKDAAERERQQKEAAAAKEEQEKKKEEARKQKEEAKQAALAKTEEAAAKAATEEKKEDGAEKAEETGDKTEEEKPKEDGEKPAEEEEKPAAAEETEKPAEEEEKKADEGEDKPAEEKEEEKPAEGGEKEEPAAASAALLLREEPRRMEMPCRGREEEIPELKLQFMPLDLASFESVLEFVKQYKESGLPLNVLICNGGLIAPAKVLTNDGLESTFQINYLSHFLLTLHLLPVLKASAPNSKIINVSSSGHKRGDGVNLDNIQSQKSYSQGKAYGNSKLFQIMNTFSLHSKIKDTGIDVFSVHPGVVDTGFSKGYSACIKQPHYYIKDLGELLMTEQRPRCQLRWMNSSTARVHSTSPAASPYSPAPQLGEIE